MDELILEIVRIDKISQQKRLLCYWYFYQRMQKYDIHEMWAEYEKILSKTDNWVEYYEVFWKNKAIDDEQELLKICDIVVETEKKSLREELRNVWRKVKEIISKEIDCEIKLREILNKKADDHPIISRIIITILIGILVGLVEDCIHDAIQMNSKQNESQVTNIYITDENNNDIQILYKQGNIVIKE